MINALLRIDPKATVCPVEAFLRSASACSRAPLLRSQHLSFVRAASSPKEFAALTFQPLHAPCMHLHRLSLVSAKPCGHSSLTRHAAKHCWITFRARCEAGVEPLVVSVGFRAPRRA